MWLAAAIFVVTMILVIAQPKGLGIGWSALIGAALSLAGGVVHWSDIPLVWHIVWNATATFIAIIIISLLLDESGFFEWAALHVARWGRGGGRRLFIFIVLLDESGFFEWAALHVARWGRGGGRRLFIFIVLLGACVAALFANDGAALILTPIVIAMLLALGFSRRATLAFVMAAGFIADTSSLPLVVSNLVNIVSADFFALPFNHYAAVMVPVNSVAVIATLAMLLLVYGRDIPVAYPLARLKPPAEAVRDRRTFMTGWGVLALLLVGFFALEPLGVPVSLVAAVAALILYSVARRGRVINTARVLRNAPWQIVIFSLGMYLVVYGLRNAGLTDLLASALNGLAARGLWIATLGTGVLTALLSSVMNNLPSVLIGALSIDASNTAGVVRQGMISANVIGCDLGPKITPIGSLATLLWLHVLAQKDIAISWGYYFRIGIMMTLPVLLITLAALVLRLMWAQ